MRKIMRPILWARRREQLPQVDTGKMDEIALEERKAYQRFVECVYVSENK